MTAHFTTPEEDAMSPTFAWADLIRSSLFAGIVLGVTMSSFSTGMAQESSNQTVTPQEAAPQATPEKEQPAEASPRAQQQKEQAHEAVPSEKEGAGDVTSRAVCKGVQIPLLGTIVNAASGALLADSVVTLKQKGEVKYTVRAPEGAYVISVCNGTYTVTATKKWV
jgi:hypothetical protein